MLERLRTDDENLKYLTSEEKNALLFFEETIDAFEDYEESPFSLNTSYGYSPRSIDYSHSETEDIIDLVQLDHGHVEKDILHDSGIGLSMEDRIPTHKDSVQPRYVMPVSLTTTVPTPAVQNSEGYSADLPGENRKFLGAVPTPVVIAQKISEKNADSFSPLTPKESKPAELKRSIGTSPLREEPFTFPSPPSANNTRFPTNIRINPVGKQYNKTISKAAVNVQERRAQMLANLHGPSLHSDEIDGKYPHEQLCRSRSTSLRDAATEQTRYEALTKLGLVKETPIQADIPTSPKSPTSNGHHFPKITLPDLPRKYSDDQESISRVLMINPSPFIPVGKTVVINSELKNKPQSIQQSQQSIPEPKLPKPHQEVRRSVSSQRPNGFRPQGITVQFSGRSASDESRKEALRKLGLL